MSRYPSRRLAATSLTAVAALVLTAACSSTSTNQSATTAGGVTSFKIWTHNGGNAAELAIDQKMVNDFNSSQKKYKVQIQSFPQESYNGAVTAAAAAKKLPCIMDIDGPNVPNWAWAGYLQPLDLPADLVGRQLPSTVGKLDSKLYAFGHYDVALNMVARASVLKANGIRIPTIDKAWTKDEFDAALAKLKSSGKYTYPLDMGTAGTGEWIPYAYSPLLQSFGADLINRAGYTTAAGTLNGPQALAWATWFRGLVTKGYMAQKSGADSTADFINGKSAIAYTGSWAAAAVTKKFGKDIAFMPPPDLGAGPKIGGGSWQWGMSTGCTAKEGALAYLKSTMQNKYYVDFAKTLSLVPGSTSAVADVPDYAPGGQFNIFFELSKQYAELRPITPAYPFIATTFAKATQDILAGGDPKQVLDKAVTDIDNNIKSNGNYKF